MALQETSGSPDMGVVQFRIERGAEAMGADGQLGTVEQIVVDRGSGELRALVVRRADGQEFEVPATHIQRATGDHVYLDIAAADLANNPEIAAPYDPEQYVPVYEGQMAPVGHAARAARDTERPVVTNVEGDAAHVVAPMTPIDTAAAPMTPGADDTAVPAPEPSPVASTTGDLMGGKPTTSGMGAASTIPPSPEPPQDTPGSERDSATLGAPAQRGYDGADEATDLGMRSAFAAGAERHIAERVEPLPDEYDRSQDAQDLAQAPLGSEPDIAEQETMVLSRGLMQPGELGMDAGILGDASGAFTPAPTLPDTAVAPQGEVERQPEEQNPLMTPLGLGLATAGLASGVLAGLIVARRRRQASATYQAQSKASKLAASVAETAGNVQSALTDTAKSMQPQVARAAAQAQAKAQRLGTKTQNTAKRANRRFRWFRRGLYLGSALALLFTPQSGAETRSRLAARLDQWRSRRAS